MSLQRIQQVFSSAWIFGLVAVSACASTTPTPERTTLPNLSRDRYPPEIQQRLDTINRQIATLHSAYLTIWRAHGDFSDSSIMAWNATVRAIDAEHLEVFSKITRSPKEEMARTRHFAELRERYGNRIPETDRNVKYSRPMPYIALTDKDSLGLDEIQKARIRELSRARDRNKPPFVALAPGDSGITEFFEHIRTYETQLRAVFTPEQLALLKQRIPRLEAMADSIRILWRNTPRKSD